MGLCEYLRVSPTNSMTTLALTSCEGIKVHLLEVLNACPAGQCNPDDCPLYKLRLWDFPERVRWLNSLTLDDLQFLSAYHNVCMQFKLTAEHPLPAVAEDSTSESTVHPTSQQQTRL
jgi:hypothetical protein